MIFVYFKSFFVTLPFSSVPLQVLVYVDGSDCLWSLLFSKIVLDCLKMEAILIILMVIWSFIIGCILLP